jgi:hypothetical protein
MSQEEINYAAVLEDLKKRREKLDAAIAAIALILGDPNAAAIAPSGNGEDLVATVKSDSFFGMSVPDAIRKFLRMSKRPQKANIIAKALQDGGIHTLSKNFYANVFTTLKRDPDFVKVRKEWGLAEWYPGRIPKKEDAKEKAISEDQAEESED